MRILITGLGAISGLGAGIAAHRRAFAAGASGVARVGANDGALPASALASRVSPVPDDGTPRVWSFLRLALSEAVADAGLPRTDGIPLYIGTVHGALEAWLAAGADARDGAGWWTPAPAAWPGMSEDLAPKMTVVSTACTASAVALGLAFDALRSGDTPVALVAGTEELGGFLYAGFDSLRALAPERCRPFDRHRHGLVLGEGAAAVVLETEMHARQRGAAAVLEFAGFGCAADACHLTAPDASGQGAAAALRQAIAQAGWTHVPDFVNAHGTGTRLNDRMECLALQRVFGAQAREIAVTSTKSRTGHMCGAAGTMELVSTALGLLDGILPSIEGFAQADPEFASWDFVGGSARDGRYRMALSMNSGFGGSNTAIALRRLT